MIKVKDLTMSYGEKIILNHIDFEIGKGEVVGLLGKNGEGKSTTMNILTGYLHPQKGEVLISDIDMFVYPKLAKQKIGYLPEIPPLYRDMKVMEYLQFAARIKKVKNVNEAVERVLGQFNLLEKKLDFIKTLSKGWQQRVGFAQCLIGDPEIIILDEPLVGLDPKESKQIKELIKSLSQNHTILISSHILKEIEELCTKVMILKNGKIVLDDMINTSKNKKNNQYRLVVKGDKDNILQLLKQSDLLADAKFIKEQETDVFEYVVVSRQKQDIRDSLFGLLVGKRYTVFGIEKIKDSLEDVFFQYNNEEE
ncbi:MAG: ABC transporter ATP-binding protein [Lachnospiraceae bacterium]